MPFSRIEIGAQVAVPKNCFEVHVTYMFGDADSYSKEVYHFSTEEDLLTFVNFLQDLKDSPYQTGSLRYEPHKHPDFDKFVINEAKDELWDEDSEHYLYATTAQMENWPNDYDGWGVGKVDEYFVTRYNEKGEAFSVSFT